MIPAENLGFKGDGYVFTARTPGYYSVLLVCKDDTGTERLIFSGYNGYQDIAQTITGTSTEIDHGFNYLGTYTLYVIGSLNKMKEYGSIESYKNEPGCVISSYSTTITERMPQPQDLTLKVKKKNGEKCYWITWSDVNRAHLIEATGYQGTYCSDTNYDTITAREYETKIKVKVLTSNLNKYANSEPVILIGPACTDIYDPDPEDANEDPDPEISDVPWPEGSEESDDQKDPTDPGEPTLPPKPKSTNRELFVADATDTAMTVDWSCGVEKMIEEWQDAGAKSWKIKKPTIGFMKLPYKINEFSKVQRVSVDFDKKQHTIKNLEPNTGYYVTVSFDYEYKKKSGSLAKGSKSFTLEEAYTGGASTAGSMKVLGVTGTTAQVDIRPLIKKIKEESLAEGAKRVELHSAYLGFADQAEGKEAALKDAKAMAGSGEYRFHYNQGNYTVRGLSTKHSYTFVTSIVVQSTFVKEGKNYQTIKSIYSVLPDVTTESYDDSAVFAPIEESHEKNTRKDLDDSVEIYPIYRSSSFQFSAEAMTDTITVDWSKQDDSGAVVSGPNNEKKIYLACVEEANYDKEADERQFGALKNFGPNVREAVKKVDARLIKVDPKDKTYTFTELDPDKSYLVMMLCSFKKGTLSYKKMYAYKRGIVTEGEKGTYDLRKGIEKFTKNADMYNVALTRKGSEAYLDWSKTLEKFFAQDYFKERFAKLLTTGGYQTAIGYCELPTRYTEKELKNCYLAARSMAYSRDYASICIDSKYTNARIFGLKPGVKYVFAIRFNYGCYEYGTLTSLEDTMYADENGLNYLKCKKVGKNYVGFDNQPPAEEEPGDEHGSGDEPGGGSDSGESGGGNGGSDSGESGGSGSDNGGSGNGSSDNGGSGSDNGGSGNDNGGSDNGGSASDNGNGGSDNGGAGNDNGGSGSNNGGSDSGNSSTENGTSAATTPVTVNTQNTPISYSENGVTYKIGVDGKATVAKIDAVKRATINVVTVNGVEYPVTSIAKNAAKGNKKLASLTIGSNVTRIESKAFYNCKKLKKVTVKANKSLSVGKGAFGKLSKDASVKINGVKGKTKKKLIKIISSK